MRYDITFSRCRRYRMLFRDNRLVLSPTGGGDKVCPPAGKRLLVTGSVLKLTKTLIRFNNYYFKSTQLTYYQVSNFHYQLLATLLFLH